MVEQATRPRKTQFKNELWILTDKPQTKIYQKRKTPEDYKNMDLTVKTTHYDAPK